MTGKIFKSILMVATAVLVASLVVIMGVLYDYFGSVQNRHLADELELAALGVSESGEAYLQKVQTSRYRLTWIAEDGTVIYDTEAGTDQLENHGEREEVVAARRDGTGLCTRYSSTLMEKTTYYACRMEDGTVLRISSGSATVGLLLLGTLQPVLVVLLLALIFSGVLAHGLSKRIVEPLNNLDLEHPLKNETYEELAPLLVRIDRQRQEIDRQLCQLRQKTDEFTQITAGLNEGLVLLDRENLVVSLNPAAQRLFVVTQDVVSQPFLTVDRDRELSLAIETARQDGHAEVHAERAGREYQFDISRIESEGTVLGTVILAFDVTDRAFAERHRREFTANVSHELKTPLQGIIGSAELIETGLAKPEDLSRFAGHIRQEAVRLVALIEDILRLSQLDEGEAMPLEPVDLLALARETEENLAATAAARQVTLSLAGEGATVTGVRRLLYEVIYNLCDNAIKYNRDGGSVLVTVTGTEKTATVTVADTGIGISPEHRERVFERFYRVDKSHSKASGGTGLGLSIVKHAVQYHRGTVTLDSEVGKGTTITVMLPIEPPEKEQTGGTVG